jgi:hypothetical protein
MIFINHSLSVQSVVSIFLSRFRVPLSQTALRDVGGHFSGSPQMHGFALTELSYRLILVAVFLVALQMLLS